MGKKNKRVQSPESRVQGRKPRVKTQEKPPEPEIVSVHVIGTGVLYRVGSLANVALHAQGDKAVVGIEAKATIVRVMFGDDTYENFGRAAVSVFYRMVEKPKVASTAGRTTNAGTV